MATPFTNCSVVEGVLLVAEGLVTLRSRTSETATSLHDPHVSDLRDALRIESVHTTWLWFHGS